MNWIETLLRREIGLDAASVGQATIQRAVRLRMKSLGLEKAEAYHRRLESSRAECEELIEAVVVNETWFFRDCDSLAAFTRLAQEWLSQNHAGPLRVLSVPCSTGEEPYTLAMCLLDAGIPPERFLIDAVDVSARALAKASRAVYGKNAFRGKDLMFRVRHFQHGKDGYLVRKPVRDCVSFHQDNLLYAAFLAGREPYQFVFCRNVLIYFDRTTQIKAIETLRGKLASSGAVFTGPAEIPLFLDNGFVTANLPMAFACRKACESPAASHPHARTVRASGPSPRTAPRTTAPSHLSNGRSRPDAPDASRPALDPPADLEIAGKLADAGKLKEAAAICETHIRQHGASAQAYYLLGLALDADGDPRAADCYRKTLYLEPDHHDALWHMALLTKKIGEHTKSSAFKLRAERARKKA